MNSFNFPSLMTFCFFRLSSSVHGMHLKVPSVRRCWVSRLGIVILHVMCHCAGHAVLRAFVLIVTEQWALAIRRAEEQWKGAHQGNLDNNL